MKEKNGNFIVYVDGASKGNPGPSGIGFLFYNNDNGELIEKGSKYIGEVTSNVAEYFAVISALKRALELKAKSIEIRSDSELIVKQLNNEYKVRSSRLKPLYDEVRNLLYEFSTFSITKIPRKANSLADKLATSAINEYLNNKTTKRDLIYSKKLGNEERTKRNKKRRRKWV